MQIYIESTTDFLNQDSPGMNYNYWDPVTQIFLTEGRDENNKLFYNLMVNGSILNLELVTDIQILHTTGQKMELKIKERIMEVWKKATKEIDYDKPI